MFHAYQLGWVARAARVPVDVVVHHRAEGGGASLAHDVDNISTSGLFVRCDEPHTVGTRVHLTIALADGSPIEAFGRVVRVGTTRDGRNGMGIMFTSVDDRSRAALERLVEAGLPPRR